MNFMFYLGKEPWYKLISRVGESWSQCGHFGEEKNLLPLLGFKT
jgi:hypothetical protein